MQRPKEEQETGRQQRVDSESTHCGSDNLTSQIDHQDEKQEALQDYTTPAPPRRHSPPPAHPPNRRLTNERRAAWREDAGEEGSTTAKLDSLMQDVPSLENRLSSRSHEKIPGNSPYENQSLTQHHRKKSKTRIRRISATLGKASLLAPRRPRGGAPSFLGSELSAPHIFVSGAVSEQAREPAYRTEVLNLFRQRLKLVSGLALVTLPAFTLFYWYLIPEATSSLTIVYALLWTYCAMLRTTAHRIKTLEMARLFSLVSYCVFSVAASDILTQAGKNNSLLFGTHNLIMLSVLLLPFTLAECALIGLIVNASMAYVMLWKYGTPQAYLYASHMVVMMTTSVFILCIAHWQGLLRRRAFDAAFDVMRSAEKLQALSFLDSLTGGFNRRYLDKTLKIEIARAIRFSRPLSVMMFDLDNFKKVNDERGHSAGDEVLREVWLAAESTIREVDTLARYGGDEFSIILPETDEESAMHIAERLQDNARERLHARYGADTLEGGVTLSIGITTVRLTEPVLPDKILDSADERLYEAKRFGKNHIAN